MSLQVNSTVKLNNGVPMPLLGLGVWKVTEEQEIERSIHTALAAGYRSIDTARVYKNERLVGQAIRSSGVPREDLFVTTKIWNEHQGYERTLQAYEESLELLGMDSVDLLLIHWPGKDKYIDTWHAMEKLYKEGAVRAIGVSNFKPHHLDKLIAASTVVPAVNQVELHPLLTQEDLRAYCQGKGIQLEAWSPLMQGNLQLPLLSDLAQKYGKTPAQIILRWNLQRQIVIIPKSVTPSRIQENADLYDFELSTEDIERINQLNQDKRFGSDPDNLLF